MWRRTRAVAAVAALALVAALVAVSDAAASQLQQDCFCSEIWACVSRKGFPYSECDQAGRKVICCVRREWDGGPGGPGGPDLSPQPRPHPTRTSSATTSPTTFSASSAGVTESHFRFSTGSSRLDGDPTRHTGISTTTATPFFETTRTPLTTPSSIRPSAFTVTTPTADTTRYSQQDPRYSSTPFERFPTTSASPLSEAVRSSTARSSTARSSTARSSTVRSSTSRPSTSRPSTVGDGASVVTSTGSPRPQDDVVTSRILAQQADPAARPASGPRSQHRAHNHKYDDDYDDSAQEIDWDDGEPHVTWSEEDFKPLRQPRVREREREQHREPKKFAYDEQKTKKTQIAVPWSSWRDCGVKGSDSGVDGKAGPSEWPWHAALLEAASDRYVCGAALVGPTWLITAAHCVMEYPDPGSLKIRVGELDVRSDTESFTQERAVVDVVPHPGFDLATLRHDIALIRVARAPRDHRNVAAVCLPPEPALRFRGARQSQDVDEDIAEEEYPKPGTTCVVTGWGRKDEESPHSEVLKEIPVPLWSRGACQDSLRQHLGDSFVLPSTAVCAGAKGKDACDGDGGGPLVCQTQPGGRWFQVGIVSYGIGCGRNGSPGVYTRVAKYASWIRGVAGNLRSIDSSTAYYSLPAPSPLPSPTNQAEPVSRVRINHYRPTITTTTPKPASRNVVVLGDEEEGDGGSGQEETEKSKDAQGTTLSPSSEEETVTTEAPRRTTPTPRKTSIASVGTNFVTESDRVGRVIHHHHHRNGLEQGAERAERDGSAKAYPFSAGTSFIRTSFGTSEWSYPLETQSNKNKTKTPLRVGMPSKWYSPNYSGSYRGEAGGARVPGQILSNVAGKTVGGMNRWYSPHYSGSYRGGYNVNVKDNTESVTKKQADFGQERVKPAQKQRAFNVRPPLAENRWYDGNLWNAAHRNGTNRSGFQTTTPKSHRFAAKQEDALKPSEREENKADAEDPEDLTWTYLVQTGSQGTVITLDRAKNETNASSTSHGDQGSASSWSYPVVSLDESRAGRTLVNISNTFTYPSAPKPGSRNASSAAKPHSNLSSSYSIYRIYPSVYNPEYTGRSRAAKALATANSITSTAKATEVKPTESSTTSTTTTEARREVGRVTEVGANGGNIVGYSRFSSGDTAVHFNITRDVPENRTVEDFTTVRTSTTDSTTGGEGMDVPPVQEHGTITTEGSDLTITPGDFSTYSDASPSTTTSILESVATVSATDSTVTTDTNSVESTTLTGRDQEQADGPSRAGRGGREMGAPRAHLPDQGGEAEDDVTARLSVLARRVQMDSRPTDTVNATDDDPVVVPRRRRPEADNDSSWGERTGSGRTPGSAPSTRSRTISSFRMGTRSKPSTPSEDPDTYRRGASSTSTFSSQELDPVPRQRPRQWSRVVQYEWPAGEVASPTSSRRPSGFHPGVRESKVVLQRSGVSNPELEEPVVVVAPEGFEQPSGKGGQLRSSGAKKPADPEQPEAPFSAEVIIPRTRSRSRQSEFRRRGTSQGVLASSTPLPAPPTAPSPLPSSSEAPVPASYVPSAAIQDNPQPIFSSPSPRSSITRNFGSKKSARKLKKIVFTSAEEQVAQNQQDNIWAPVATAPLSTSSSEAVANDSLGGDRPEHAVVDDIEREDVYSFISQRAKRRRVNVAKANPERTGESSPGTASAEQEVPVAAIRVASRGVRRRPSTNVQ